MQIQRYVSFVCSQINMHLNKHINQNNSPTLFLYDNTLQTTLVVLFFLYNFYIKKTIVLIEGNRFKCTIYQITYIEGSLMYDAILSYVFQK